MSIFRPILKENEKDARFALVVLAKKLPIHALIAIFQFVMNMPILCVMTVYRFHEILDKPAFNKSSFN